MKKIKLLSIASLLLFSGMVNGQAILSEDFNGANPFVGWTLINNDGLTPATNVGAINNAWVVLNVSGEPAALSTSWYTPAGTADDYMITPALTLPMGSSPYVFFDGIALDASFPDGYEVRISTTTPTIAGLMANPALLTVTAETTTWNSRNLNLSAYAGQTVYLAWRNNSTDQFVLAMDNIVVRDVANEDAGITDLTVSSSYTTGSTVTVTGELENAGLNALTAVNLNWSTDGGTTVNTDMLTINVPSFSTTNFSHSVTFTAANPGAYTDLMVWTSSPNGVTDPLTANDTLSMQVFVNNGTTVSRNVLLEEFTTAPCQFCPDGAVVVEQILNSNPNVIGVGEHACFGTDAMTIPAASTYCAAFGSGAPTACIDRILFPGETTVAHGRGTWATNANARSLIGSPADVMITGTYNNGTRQVNVNLTTNFVDYALPGDIRVTLFVVEDHVTGTGNGYNQVNAYNTQAGHPYAGAGNPIIGYDHRHVLRDVYPSNDAWGDATVIPSSPQVNTNYTKNYSFALNPGWKDTDVSLVGFVNYFNADVNQREVINAFEVKLGNLVTSVEEINKDENSLSVYPNPTAEVTNFKFDLSESKNVNLSIRDITGKLVLSKDFGKLGAGKQLLQLNLSDLSNGIYFTTLQLGEEVVTKKISVNK